MKPIYKIARHSILGIEWYYPVEGSKDAHWTFEGVMLDYRFSLRSDAVKTAYGLCWEQRNSQLEAKICLAKYKDGIWEFTEVKL